MLLCEALDLNERALVAAVGAGGKTSLLHCLGAELAARGDCVISTTTTAIWEPGGVLILEPSEEALLVATTANVAPGRIITVATGRQMVHDPFDDTLRPKLGGVQAHVPERLLALPGVSYVLVEADGARGRSIKAPAQHEPVMPAAATHVLAVAGIDALGEPLTEAIAHRPERIAALLGIPIGTPLSPAHIAALLANPAGGRKGAPEAASFVPFINKVQDEALLLGARAIAAHLLKSPGINRVLIGAALARQPVLEVWR